MEALGLNKEDATGQQEDKRISAFQCPMQAGSEWANEFAWRGLEKSSLWYR